MQIRKYSNANKCLLLVYIEYQDEIFIMHPMRWNFDGISSSSKLFSSSATKSANGQWSFGLLELLTATLLLNLFMDRTLLKIRLEKMNRDGGNFLVLFLCGGQEIFLPTIMFLLLSLFYY